MPQTLGARKHKVPRNLPLFDSRRYRVDENGCWIWQASLTTKGYGQIQRGDKRYAVHRLYYERYVGPIPAGFHIDHLCRTPACVNPDHLEAVTPGENVLRGFGAPAQHARKTHCKNGHPFAGDNLLVRATDGARVCLICRAAEPSRQSEARRKR